jgi:hypothetical protein
MKRNSLVTACLVGCVIAGALPARAITAGNPYLETITNRNLFALNPPPDPTLVAAKPAVPPPNIFLTGITTIMGGKRALLRVARPARPPEPAREVPLILKEGGPEEEGVQVLEINIAAGTVRVRNQGVDQLLDMEKNAPKGPPSAPAPGGAAPGLRGPSPIPVPLPHASPAPSSAPPGFSAAPSRQVRTGSAGNNAGGAGLQGAGPSGLSNQAQDGPPPLTLEEQTIMIEVERVRTQAQVDAGDLPPLPPTDLTPGQEGDGQNPPAPF